MQILGVLELLVKYGYYDDPKDIEALLEPILSMLSGLNDTPGVSKFLLCSMLPLMLCMYVHAYVHTYIL